MKALIIVPVLIVLALTVTNVMYALNIRSYVDLMRRGMVRVRVIYTLNGKRKVLRGWSYQVDLKSIMSNPVSQSSAFIKVYEKGTKETVVAFSTVERLQVLEDSYVSVITAKRTYL